MDKRRRIPKSWLKRISPAYLPEEMLEREYERRLRRREKPRRRVTGELIIPSTPEEDGGASGAPARIWRKR